MLPFVTWHCDEAHINGRLLGITKLSLFWQIMNVFADVISGTEANMRRGLLCNSKFPPTVTNTGRFTKVSDGLLSTITWLDTNVRDGALITVNAVAVTSKYPDTALRIGMLMTVRAASIPTYRPPVYVNEGSSNTVRAVL